ncbi:hypothetical protein F8S13_12160 [Chloroflexia bacterium SDU3-3]|nr:hypothetical protein F8S13_12160 [Chloroflexia bacterium SDU3-3]
MKLNREFWLLAAGILIPFAGFWLLIQTPTSQLNQIPSWLSLAIFLLPTIYWVSIFSQNILPIWGAIKKNPAPLLVWLYFWLAAISFIFFQHMQQLPPRPISLSSTAFRMMTATGVPTFVLSQKLQEEKSVVWLTIAGLSYICACISVYAGIIG